MPRRVHATAGQVAGSDSLATVPPIAAGRETVYIERIITERVINPQASVTMTTDGPTDRYVRVLAGLGIVGGWYMIIHGHNNPHVELNAFVGNTVRAEQSTNSLVYLGAVVVAVSVLSLAF